MCIGMMSVEGEELRWYVAGPGVKCPAYPSIAHTTASDAQDWRASLVVLFQERRTTNNNTPFTLPALRLSSL
jgi:hypothetical protein